MLSYLILYYLILYYLILSYIILYYIIYLSIYPSLSPSMYIYICIIHVIYIYSQKIYDSTISFFHLRDQSSEPKRRGKVPRDGGKASAAAQIFPRFFCFRIVFLSFNFGQVEDSQTVQENHNKHNVLGNLLQGNHPIFGGCSADM